jgi:uncharacterized protein (DUF608 family)
LAGPAWADSVQQEVPAEEIQRWKKALFQPSPARLYRSGIHTDARMHLGGIGTGTIEIGCDGQFTNWQLFNTLRDGHLPLLFVVKAGNTARLLQTAGGPSWPRVTEIEMTGEYPIATLRYIDPELPVRLELSAFTPFAPLDTRFSSQPLAVLVFRVQNPTAQDQRVSLAGLMQNPVGYDALGAIDGACYPKFGGNVNEPLRDAAARGLLMRAEAGREASLDRPVSLHVGSNMQPLMQVPPERPKNLTLAVIPDETVQSARLADARHSVIWWEEPAVSLAEAALRGAREAVAAGATLLLSGATMPLLDAYARHSADNPPSQPAARPDVVFEDFEHGYGQWTAEGNFMTRGPIATQSQVTGFLGQGLANSMVLRNDSIGRLISRPFTVARNYIRFLIGGSALPTTQIRLLVDGRVVRAASGPGKERLLPGRWDVREFAGRTAHLEIVDAEKGSAGHIYIDQIEFSDQLSRPAVLRLLDEMLPARFTGFHLGAGKQPAEANALVFENLRLRPQSEQRALRSGFDVLVRPLGKGKVALAAGAILDPGQILDRPEARQKAYGAVCELAGARYTPLEIPSPGVSRLAQGFGTLALAAVAGTVTVLPAFEDWNVAWEALQQRDGLVPLDAARPNLPTAAGRSVNGAVAAAVVVPAGGSVDVPFLLAWHFPNKYCLPGHYNTENVWMGCHYATLWPDAAAVIHEAAASLPAIRGRTELFRKTFYDSTLPYWMLDCITSQAATIRHAGVVFRVANGDVYGWEGSNGCCPPTCTHVWGYEQSLARLFPDLEQEMRRIDFKYQQLPDGGINNRTIIPAPPHPTGEHPFVDGHASCVLKAYREALNHPRPSFFQEYWPYVKRAVEYLIRRDAAGAGGTPHGVLQDDQFNTYDQALHGVTSFLSGYYLAALRAAEEWAKRLGDTSAAQRFHAIFLSGQENLVRRCWNGEYFQQDLPDYLTRLSEPFPGATHQVGEIGPGCLSDQLIGQWWAHQLGLGYILPRDKVQSGLRSIFKYNWVPRFTGAERPRPALAGPNDKGLVICTWPRGGRPPITLSNPNMAWTGIEYEVAALMIYEGMIEEGFAIVKSVRDRYDGIPRPPMPRNPWNERECGGHYARAMSSWSLLLAASGFEYDGPSQALRFTPHVTPADFKALFTGPESWGSLRQIREGATQRNEIRVCEGRLAIARLCLAPPAAVRRLGVTLDHVTIEAALTPGPDDIMLVTFSAPILIEAGGCLAVALS